MRQAHRGRALCRDSSHDEKTLYVANGLGDDVSIIDTASRKAKVSVPVGRVPYGIVVDE
jgi:YVTN family beta-propeller protein